MTALIEIRVPDIGDFSDVPVIEIPVAPGDEIADGDTIIVLESDKATLDVPSDHAGRIAELSVNIGDKVSKGALIARIEATAATTNDAAANSGTNGHVEPAPQTQTVSLPAPTVQSPASPATPRDVINPQRVLRVEPDAPAYASPSVRAYARQLGVAIAQVSGSGAKGRITRSDVEAYVKHKLTAVDVPARPSASDQPGALSPLVAGLPDWPRVDHEKYGPTERVALSRIVRKSGPALARNALVIPHVTNFDKADITDLEAFRKSLNAEAREDDAKVTILAFVVKAIVLALKAYPKFNASLDGDELVLKQYWNIGIAADTPDGLVVPVVKQADAKGIREIANEMADLAATARAGKLKPADMQGATFTISSLGGIGGTNFTPIINAPEVAILGMTRAEFQPVWTGEDFSARLIQPLSLSWDHRVVDGVAAARFLVHVAQTLGDFRRAAV